MKNFGFKEPAEDLNRYKLGGGLVPKIILQTNGNWFPYLPLYERQFGDGWDSYGCTVFGTLNCIETIFEKVYGSSFDFSERYIYNLVEVEPPGADPHEVSEKIRKNGVIKQDDLPFVDSIEEFKRPRPMTKWLIDKGHLWLARYDFKHEWVFEKSDKLSLNKRHELIAECLKYSPLGISVTAWEKDENGEYVSKGHDNTHWCMAFKIEKDRVYVFDSYDQEIKVLSPTHDIQYCKRYYIIEKTPEDELNYIRLSLISIILNYVKRLIKSTGQIIEGVLSKKN